MGGTMRKGQKSDLSRAFSEDGAHKTHVGGQALLEGIMMRGKFNWAVAVREPDGNIYVEEHDLASGRNKNSWLHWPLVRGCTALVESLMLGYKALEIAALHAFDDEDEGADLKPSGARGGEASGARGGESGEGLRSEASQPSLRPSPDSPLRCCEEASASPERCCEEGFEPLGGEGETSNNGEGGADVRDARPADEKPSDEGSFGKAEMTISMVLGIVLGVVLFIVAPAFLTNLIVGEYDQHTLLWNAVDGVLRVAVFVFYIWLIGRMQDIRRMFMYHGAEHKTIHCYEHGLELTPENARQFPRLHVRCGTAFLIMVMIIAILVYTILPLNAIIAGFGVPEGAPKLVLVIVSRIVFMPVIAGISYEITVKWAGSHPDNPLVKVILWPGMQMQYLTTNEPDDEQLECAIAAMNRVLAREEAEAHLAEAREGSETERAPSTPETA